MMATFNENPSFLRRCVDSVLNQTFKDFELIIVVEPDERNISYLHELDDRVRIIANDSKNGFVKSLNVGIENSKGKYIARIDSDDYCDLTRFEKQVKFLNENSEISVVGTNLYLVDDHNNIIGRRESPETSDDIRKSFLLSTPLIHSSVMIRKKDLEEIGLYSEEFIRSEDLEIFLRFLANGKKFFNLQEYLLYYRVGKGQLRRDNMHWRYNYMARRLYSKSIWSLRERFLSLFIYFVISRTPDIFIERLFNLTMVMRFLNKIRNVRMGL